ncbi:hypothetical protein [Streptococcus pluranimalium]
MLILIDVLTLLALNNSETDVLALVEALNDSDTEALIDVLND